MNDIKILSMVIEGHARGENEMVASFTVDVAGIVRLESCSIIRKGSDGRLVVVTPQGKRTLRVANFTTREMHAEFRDKALAMYRLMAGEADALQTPAIEPADAGMMRFLGEDPEMQRDVARMVG